MTNSLSGSRSDDAIFYPVKCATCGHAEGEHAGEPHTSCMVPGCDCDDFAPDDAMAS